MINEGLRIVQFTAQNVKRLKLVSITPKGAVVPITGRNGQGKTSVLDAIWWALGGKDNITAVPIRKGAESGSITLDLGQFVVERTFTSKKKCPACRGTGKPFDIKPALDNRTFPDCADCAGSGWIAENGSELSVRAPSAVEGQKGPKYSSPQAMLDALVGSLSFDPLEFVRMDPKAQFAVLREACKPEVDFDKLAADNKADFDARALLNKAAKTARSLADQIEVVEGLPAELVDVEAIGRELRTAYEANSQLQIATATRYREGEKLDEREEKLTGERTRLEEMRAAADRLEQMIATSADVIAKERQLLNDLPPLGNLLDVKEIEARSDEGKRTNVRIARRDQRTTAIADAEAHEKASKDLTKQMELREESKVKAIQACAMPVEGLTFGEGCVEFNGLPFDQTSDAERLRVSIGIAMATNPKLRVIRIRDGSLLDEDSMKVVAEMAKSGGYQFWMERVDASGKVGIVLEDGEVVADNQVEEETNGTKQS